MPSKQRRAKEAENGEMVVVNIKMPRAMLAKVDQICRAEERSRSWILRNLVYDGLHLRDDKGAEQ